jgi:hypothetical protein
VIKLLELLKLKPPRGAGGWAWALVVVCLIFLKLSEDEKRELRKDLRECNASKEKSDAVESEFKKEIIKQAMDKAFKNSQERILQPVIDSIKREQS